MKGGNPRKDSIAEKTGGFVYTKRGRMIIAKGERKKLGLGKKKKADRVKSCAIWLWHKSKG